MKEFFDTDTLLSEVGHKGGLTKVKFCLVYVTSWEQVLFYATPKYIRAWVCDYFPI